MDKNELENKLNIFLQAEEIKYLTSNLLVYPLEYMEKNIYLTKETIDSYIKEAVNEVEKVIEKLVGEKNGKYSNIR